MEPLGDVLRRQRQALGLSQAALAEGAGVHLRQIRRYESGEQQPVLAVAARLADTLGVSVDELAGRTGTLSGTWWAAWQLFNDGHEVLAMLPVELTHHGTTVELEAVEGRAASWHGELRSWRHGVLTGWYGDARSRGTMLFVLAADSEQAEGRWAGSAPDGRIATGHAALARTRENAQAVLERLVRVS
jgi:transcriptional regulator with XRE-family HTH domain